MLVSEWNDGGEDIQVQRRMKITAFVSEQGTQGWRCVSGVQQGQKAACVAPLEDSYCLSSALCRSFKLQPHYPASEGVADHAEVLSCGTLPPCTASLFTLLFTLDGSAQTLGCVSSS